MKIHVNMSPNATTTNALRTYLEVIFSHLKGEYMFKLVMTEIYKLLNNCIY